MKRITTFILIMALVFQGALSLAQIDADKMERDLRVASGVLASLMNNNNDKMFRGGEPEVNYVDGFGVIFTIEDNMIFKYNYNVQYKIAHEAEREAKMAIREMERAQRDVERELRYAGREVEEANRVKKEVQAEARAESKGKAKNKSKSNSNSNYEPNIIVEIPPMPPMPEIEFDIDEEELEELKEQSEEANEEFTENLKEAFETFLADYSQLIGQLKPTDKILLSTKSNDSFVFAYSMEDQNYGYSKEKSRLSAEMLVKDHKDFQSGKIDRDDLIDKIKFVENAEMERKPDLDLFGSMLKTNYNAKYTETYFISSMPKYEFLAGLGVVYNVKVYSSYEENGGYRMPGTKKSGLSKEERDKTVETMYPQFVESFKENMIRYGSTIKSLKDGDKLIVKVKMTSCKTCTFPTTVEYMVDKSVLDQFTKGSLTLAQAKGKVKLK